MEVKTNDKTVLKIYKQKKRDLIYKGQYFGCKVVEHITNNFIVVIVLYLFRSHRVAWINGRRERSDLLIGELRSGRKA